MPLYFAYGSNMLRARLERRVGDVQDLGCAPLGDYRHTFAKKGHDGSAKGAIVLASGHRVYGVLYALEHTQLETLATYEGGYRRIEVWVGGERVITFEPLPHLLREGLQPTAEYVRYYLDGMREHGFPAHYVQEIRRQIARALGDASR